MKVEYHRAPRPVRSPVAFLFFSPTLKELIHAPVLQIQELVVDGLSLFISGVNPVGKCFVVRMPTEGRVGELCGESMS